MSRYLNIHDNPCKMWKCDWFWEAISILRGRGMHYEAIDSASGSCSMQPHSWLLWTDPGWSKFTCESNFTDSLKNIFPLEKCGYSKMTISSRNLYLLKRWMGDPLRPKRTIWSERENFTSSLPLFRGLSWAIGEQLTSSPGMPNPGQYLGSAWPRNDSSFPQVRSQLFSLPGFCRYLVSAGQNMPIKRG